MLQVLNKYAYVQTISFELERYKNAYISIELSKNALKKLLLPAK